MLENNRRGGYSISEVAHILQFHPDAVQYWLRTGELSGRHDHLSDEWRIAQDDLVAFLRQNGETLPSELVGAR
ncbi:MAG TPA: helix-turn-helix domain-containing protein [Nitrolancea sp.]